MSHSHIVQAFDLKAQMKAASHASFSGGRTGSVQLVLFWVLVQLLLVAPSRSGYLPYRRNGNSHASSSFVKSIGHGREINGPAAAIGVVPEGLEEAQQHSRALLDHDDASLYHKAHNIKQEEDEDGTNAADDPASSSSSPDEADPTPAPVEAPVPDDTPGTPTPSVTAITEVDEQQPPPTEAPVLTPVPVAPPDTPSPVTPQLTPAPSTETPVADPTPSPTEPPVVEDSPGPTLIPPAPTEAAADETPTPSDAADDGSDGVDSAGSGGREDGDDNKVGGCLLAL